MPRKFGAFSSHTEDWAPNLLPLATPLWAEGGLGGRIVGRGGRGSVGRASPCQGEGRGFESRRPLWKVRMPLRHAPCGGVAEWLRQGPAKPCTRVRFPSPPPRPPGDTERHGPMRPCRPALRAELYRSWITGDVHGRG